jgi:hypothetical protein
LYGQNDAFLTGLEAQPRKNTEDLIEIITKFLKEKFGE